MEPLAASPPPRAAAPMRFAVVDVETSGLSPTRHRLLQVAVVVSDASGQVLDTWVSLVRPRWRWFFRLGPRHIHGLRRTDLRRAEPAPVVLRELSRRIDGAVLTAHNAEFDMAFLRAAAQRAGVTLDLGTSLCTLWLSRHLDPDRTQSHRLADLATRYGVVNGKPHDALEDALATATVLPHLLQAHGVTDASALVPHLRHAGEARPHSTPRVTSHS
ncbi:MAG TPA: 3'-5' exonuclease [Ilumatobacteraceae bacterium]|nr:3'-5' exonuclease [Ilumatobacteraceae bacterium]